MEIDNYYNLSFGDWDEVTQQIDDTTISNNQDTLNTTQVTYRLAVELGPLVPGFIRTEGARRVIENALERLKRRVEMG